MDKMPMDASRSRRDDTGLDKRIRPAIFLDRDGTIIEDRGHLGKLESVELFPFAVPALRMLQKHYLLFIVTNQSGVALGRVSMEEVTRVNQHVMAQLQSQGVRIQQLYCCSHKKDDKCECIKPNPYFIHQAHRTYGIDITRSYTIGDHPHDVAFGQNAGANGIYVLTGHGRKHFEQLEPATRCFENLLEAATWILAKDTRGT
jgi:histidinol-phosphate phosphatase family protein